MLERKKPLKRRKPLGPGKKALARGSWRKRSDDSQSTPNHSEPGQSGIDTKARAHAALWPLLRDGVRGFAFREHERLGPVIADFFCPAAQLVLEIVIDTEDAGSAWIEAQGYRVLRFDAGSLARNPQQALEAIADCFTLRVISRPQDNNL